MNDLTLPIEGHCRCGAVRIEISASPVMTAACHCTGCQRMSGSAYSLTVMIPAEGFRVLSGTPVRGGAKGEELDHYCCPECMSWMFTRIRGVETLVNVRPTMFDNATWAKPFIETMTAEKLPWAHVDAERSFEGFPPMEEFWQLLEDFAAHRRAGAENIGGPDE